MRRRMPRPHGRCDYCGKWSFPSRRAARRAYKQVHTHEAGLNAYRCQHRPDWAEPVWHYGHRNVTGVAS